jgi:hypothetical protein
MRSSDKSQNFLALTATYSRIHSANVPIARRLRLPISGLSPQPHTVRKKSQDWIGAAIELGAI